MEQAAKTWLRASAEAFLRREGVREGESVLDFGCNKGNYTIPAAMIVGETGTVYAVDKDKARLRDLKRTAKKQGLENIEVIHLKEDHDIPLSMACVDVVLLYDVLHRGYLPEASQRESLLRRLRRVLKPGGLLSCYPTHLRQYNLTLKQLVKEVESTSFRLRGKSRRTLVHDEKLVRGDVFSFSKC